jgi:hypothetical protein
MTDRALPISSALIGIAVVALITVGCGAGPYGFSRYYTPLGDEEDLYEKTAEYPYQAVTSDPADYQDKTLRWFGIVEQVDPADDGRYRVRMSHHQHQDRHLCDGETDSSCRVTVHFKSSGGFTALIKLRQEDVVPGLDKVQPGSLLHVYGKVRCRYDEDDEETICDYDDLGGPLIDGIYYRQWPARYFVTTRAASSMRR